VLVYSVTVAVQRDAEEEWLEWMTSVHVPDVVRTGCFSRSRIFRVLGAEGDEPTYVIQYYCDSMEEYRRYQENFAPALQKDHTDRFAGRFRASRQLVEEVAPAQ
jgi:hypothetical protein